jgi:hypothetical protein
MPLPWKGFCHRRVFAFKVPLHLPSKGLCLQSTLPLAWKRLCHRRAFAIERPLPLELKGLGHLRAIEGPLSSKRLWHGSAFAVEGSLPLPSKGLFLEANAPQGKAFRREKKSEGKNLIKEKALQKQRQWPFDGEGPLMPKALLWQSYFVGKKALR